MKKESYERAELEVIRFNAEDVIMTSGERERDEYETPRIPQAKIGDVMKKIRSFLLFLLCASILALSVLSVSAAGGYIRGDADGDGVVSILDATVIQRYLVDVPVIYINENAADIDGNTLDISDVTRIQRYLVGVDNPFSIGEYVSEKTPADYDEYELPVV